MKNRLLHSCITFLFFLLMMPLVHARNLDLSTVPERQEVELTIYNSEDLTLVREKRTLGFKQGINPLQFSWSNTLIDPTSVELTFGDEAGKLKVLDTTFPHDKPEMLYWNVEAEEDLTVRVEISYFTSGIQWSADYVAVTDPDERVMDLDGFVRVENHSGEDYENASVRLVVGEINLVEKIAELARIPTSQVSKMEQQEYRQVRMKVARKAMAMPAPMMEMSMADAGAGYAAQSKPKEVAKEGLGEYFIYTIEGKETIPDGWAKRLRSFRAGGVPVDIVYRYREAEYGNQLIRLYLLTNDKDSKLGETPIPNGDMRILRRDAQGGVVYLTRLTIQYVPIGDKLELNLGVDPEVIFELVKQRVFRDNIWMHIHKGNVYKRVDDGHLKVDHNASVEGWDEHGIFEQRIRNYTDKSIKVEVRRSFAGDVVFKSGLGAKAHDYRTVEYESQVKAGEKVALEYEVITASGYNSKQNRVTIEER